MEQSFKQRLNEKCNKKCFAVKISVKESVFKEVEKELWKTTSEGRVYYHYKGSSKYGKGEGVYGEKIDNDFIEAGRLKKVGTTCNVILNKQCYGKSLKDIELAVDELIASEKAKSFDSFLHKWQKGRSKEDLVETYNKGTLDYDVEIQELKYIVLENKSLFELTKILNEHVKFGWKVNGSMQSTAAGGGEGVHEWSERHYLQSLWN
jgi:hypothetical protein